MSKWINQTDLGSMYGLSARDIGKYLTDLKLKNPTPTDYALNNEFAKPIQMKNGIVVYLWNVEKVAKILDTQLKRLTASEKIFLDLIKELINSDDLSNFFLEMLFEDLNNENEKNLANLIVSYFHENNLLFCKLFTYKNKIKSDKQILAEIERISKLLTFS